MYQFTEKGFSLRPPTGDSSLNPTWGTPWIANPKYAAVSERACYVRFDHTLDV